MRAVDDLLKKEFGLPDGLADDSTFSRTITDARFGDKKTGRRSATVTQREYRVQILEIIIPNWIQGLGKIKRYALAV